MAALSAFPCMLAWASSRVEKKGGLHREKEYPALLLLLLLLQVLLLQVLLLALLPPPSPPLATALQPQVQL